MDGTTTRPAGDASPSDLGDDLLQALADGGAGLRLDLQPICAATSLAPVGYEALLRWDHPQLGALSAAALLAAAASVEQEVALDAWVMVTAFRLRAGWKRGGPYLAVNISAAGIRDGHAAPMVRAALGSTLVDPRGLSLELPEAAVAEHLCAAGELAAVLRAEGIAVALDDFGGSLGSARVLRDIPFGVVKLDPLLTEGVDLALPGGERTRAAVAAVVDMAHALGATVIAEAVETAEQMRALRLAGCDGLQGWLLGRPGLGPG